MGCICITDSDEERYQALIRGDTTSFYENYDSMNGDDGFHVPNASSNPNSSTASPVISVVPAAVDVASPVKVSRRENRAKSQSYASSYSSSATSQLHSSSNLASSSSSSSLDKDARHSCLLLGTGESGKSTVLKQLRLLYESSTRQFNASVLNQFKHIIRQNVCQEMQSLCDAVAENAETLQHVMMELDILRLQYLSQTPPSSSSSLSSSALTERPSSFSSSSSSSSALLTLCEKHENAAAIMQIVKDNDSWVDNLSGPAVQFLWQSKSLREYYMTHKLELQLPDCCEYFFNHVETIQQDGYVPENMDILYARIRTSGVTEVDVEIRNAKFRFIDMGGQRNERRKWHVRSNEAPTAIIFVAAINEYNQNLYEDEKINRLQESISLFNEVCNHQLYTKIPIILFLNKTDLFERDWNVNAFVKVFPEFTKVNQQLQRQQQQRSTTFASKAASMKAARSFIEDCYLDCNVSPGRKVYRFFTCATDTSNVEKVSQSVRDIIVRKSLNASLGGAHGQLF